MTENPFDNDLPNQVSAACDMIDNEPRIVQWIQCCNEELLIRECMLQLYDEVDKIIVIEGAVTNKVDSRQATPDGHSLDRTVEIVREVKENEDPDKKILFVQIDRPWNDLEELKNAFLSYMREGDWILITDADEFIHPDVVKDLRKAISLEPWVMEFVPAGFFHFWRDAYHVRKPSGAWGQQHQRFLKFQPGMYYRTHPVATDKDGVCTYFDQRYYLNRRFVLPSFYVYHYSYCKGPDDIKTKKEFYEKELGQDKHGHVGAYERGGQTDEYLNFKEMLETVLRFDEQHPPIMEGHPILAYKEKFYEDKEFVNYKEVEPYNLKPDEMGVIWIWQNIEKRMPFFSNYVEIVE